MTPRPPVRIDGCADLSALADTISPAGPTAAGVPVLRPAGARQDSPAGDAIVTLEFPAGYSPSAKYTFFQCGANMRTNRWVKASITRQIREDVLLLARQQGLPQITCRVDVLGVQHPAPGRRAIDSENISPLTKAAIDGLRDAGVLRNDSPRYVRTVANTTGPRVAGGQLILHITLLGELP